MTWGEILSHWMGCILVKAISKHENNQCRWQTTLFCCCVEFEVSVLLRCVSVHKYFIFLLCSGDGCKKYEEDTQKNRSWINMVVFVVWWNVQLNMSSCLFANHGNNGVIKLIRPNEIAKFRSVTYTLQYGLLKQTNSSSISYVVKIMMLRV